MRLAGPERRVQLVHPTGAAPEESELATLKMGHTPPNAWMTAPGVPALEALTRASTGVAVERGTQNHTPIAVKAPVEGFAVGGAPPL